jgi:hypothetical protein
MDYWEIRDSNGDLVQRILTLTGREKVNLRNAGFSVERVEMEVDDNLAEILRPIAWSRS